MQEPPMTAAVKAELDALKSASRTVANFREWSVVEYVRSKPQGSDELMWWVQMVTEDGPKTFSYDAIIEYAAQIRKAESDEYTDAEAPVSGDTDTVSE